VPSHGLLADISSGAGFQTISLPKKMANRANKQKQIKKIFNDNLIKKV